jgi:hypothetical protein
MRNELVKGAADYFNGPHWDDFMANHLLREKGEEVYHIHLYVDTKLHPKTLEQLIDRYFNILNRPLDRSMDPQQQRKNVASVHGIHPVGCPHWEMIFRFNEHTILGPMPTDSPESEHGKNILSWDRACMNEFMTKIPFKVAGPREDAIIKEYFSSKHWKDTLAYVVDPGVTHVHPNIEISFNPKIFEIYACQAMKEIGWVVDKVVPCIFDMKTCVRDKNLPPDDPRNTYAGKINFNLGHPEKMFDYAWMFNPNVVIRPAQQEWIFDTPGFDVWKMTNYDAFLAANNYVELTKEEINAVVSAFCITDRYIRKL